MLKENKPLFIVDYREFSNMKILLASGSSYRKSLLQRLQLPFIQASPDIDESPQNNESPRSLVLRLSREKAFVLAKKHPDTLIISSDQAADLNGRILGKPGSEPNAIRQLSDCSGQKVTFHTGICLLNTSTGNLQMDCIDYHVWFRTLTPRQITNYIKKEQPLDCAGSFKCEGLGITLFTKMAGDDANSLIGLPLIRLTDMLINEDVHPLHNQ